MKNENGGKILLFDLETTDLSADRGHILCAAAKWVGEDTVLKFSIDETKRYGTKPSTFFDDSGIVRRLIPLLEEADAVVAHFGKGFDVPYLNTRAFYHGITPPAPYTLIDTWAIAKSQLRLSRNSLGNVADHFGTVYRKTHLPWSTWQLAQYGCRESLAQLLKYCVNDINVLESVYLRLRPVIKLHPYVGALPASGMAARCPACGSTKHTAQGVRRTRLFEVFRARCANPTCRTAYEIGRRKIK